MYNSFATLFSQHKKYFKITQEEIVCKKPEILKISTLSGSKVDKIESGNSYCIRTYYYVPLQLPSSSAFKTGRREVPDTKLA